jgi:hypothetical protein
MQAQVCEGVGQFASSPAKQTITVRDERLPREQGRYLWGVAVGSNQASATKVHLNLYAAALIRESCV